MAQFQQWYLLNNIDENISLIEKLLDKKHNNYYFLSQTELDELLERLNEFKKFKILIKIKDDIIKDKELDINNNLIVINQLKRKIKNQDNYINRIHLYSIIILFFNVIITFYFCHFYTI